jgi:branched-chain amino acid transport system substrate-binding protein
MLHDVYRVQIKSPAESQGEWDSAQACRHDTGDKAFRPLAAGSCPALAP